MMQARLMENPRTMTGNSPPFQPWGPLQRPPMVESLMRPLPMAEPRVAAQSRQKRKKVARRFIGRVRARPAAGTHLGNTVIVVGKASLGKAGLAARSGSVASLGAGPVLSWRFCRVYLLPEHSRMLIAGIVPTSDLRCYAPVLAGFGAFGCLILGRLSSLGTNERHRLELMVPAGDGRLIVLRRGISAGQGQKKPSFPVEFVNALRKEDGRGLSSLPGFGA
jgi:hypothetical protein